MMTKAWARQVPENFKLNEDEWPGSNARKSEESFADYKIRRLVQNELMKIYLRGRVFWNSKEDGPYHKGAKENTVATTKPGNWDDLSIWEAA